MARLLVDQIARVQGATIVIENRAGGTVGADAAARAAPDGSTLLIHSNLFVIEPQLKRANYDPLTSFAPICKLVSSPSAIVVNAASSYRTLADLIAAARAKPGELTVATVGPGSAVHLAFELLKRSAGVDMTYVPYGGGMAPINAVVGGHVTASFAIYAQVGELIKAGKLRAEVARAVLPRNTIATCDAGASRLLVVQKWESYGPREFLTSNGLASMGYAVPGALAARMAYPDRPVVAFTGDGGFLMTVAELQTAQRENLPIIVLVFDDREIGLIRVKQEIKGIPPHGVQLGGVDWEKLAQSFGADGVVVETEQALSNALSAAVKSKRTTVIGVRINSSGYVAQFNALREL